MRAPAGCRIRETRGLGGPHRYSTGYSRLLDSQDEGACTDSYLSSNSSICSHGPSPTPIITMLIANLHRQHDRFPKDECVRALRGGFMVVLNRSYVFAAYPEAKTIASTVACSSAERLPAAVSDGRVTCRRAAAPKRARDTGPGRSAEKARPARPATIIPYLERWEVAANIFSASHIVIASTHTAVCA